MLTDIEIAQSAKLKPITEIAEEIGIFQGDLDLYGKYKAKVNLKKRKGDKLGKLVLVTAVNPTPAGEGKTTVSIGLAQGLCKLLKKDGKRAVLALREPSLGPVFGVKGGAAGGGYSQVLPMEDINLHFTGDMHAITSANNLLCAMLDNHIHQGNALGIDSRRVLIKRCLDMNDRSLRNIVVGLGKKVDGVPRQDGFIITVASEVMAILCLSEDLDDLKKRLGKILVAYTYDNNPVFADDIKATGAMASLLKDAINPNLVQTIENTPAIIHGGPFANIAHGCNSVRATKLALQLGDYAVTEAGFGSDLGAEKFYDIKCRSAGLEPSCAVLVTTVRALKHNAAGSKLTSGGVPTPQQIDSALIRGIVNLKIHIENLGKFGVPVVVAINQFHADTEAELDYIREYCAALGVRAIRTDVFANGGNGGLGLAQAVFDICELGGVKTAYPYDLNNIINEKLVKVLELTPSHEIDIDPVISTTTGEISNMPLKFKPLYDLDLPFKEKLNKIAKEIYRADGVDYSKEAEKSLKQIESLGFGNLPVCVAKTQYSLSDDPTKLGNPLNFRITVRELRLSAGAGFIVALTGDIMTLPGLPKVPSANNIDIDGSGTISGLF